ncbi:hypothetical protein [Leptolyngbya ohadii]|nr:hypothetical protein [Leptolyngbya ohadii]
MRYSIMLQIVAGTTVVLVGAAALFAWIQNRSTEVRSQSDSTRSELLTVR